ncbi:MAG TPA: PKD domain-containing protein [Rhodothermales bacterium]|nr:PKD domain-containing protein [Rhodothermales bacterium]HRR08395.1 PKD domain-containing protein [Rhodothermales bacterium]
MSIIKKISQAFLLLLLVHGGAMGQSATQVVEQTRNGKSLYVKLMGGLNVYGGDTDGIPHYKKISLVELGDYLKSIGYSGRIEVGLPITKRFDVALAGEYGHYPNIEPNEGPFALPFSQGKISDEKRLHLDLLGRFNILPDNSINPFVQLGGNLTFGKTTDIVTSAKSTKLGFGPSGGFGVDVKVSDKLSVVLENNHALVFPDIAVDGADYATQLGSSGDDQDHDWLSFYGIGAKLKIGSGTGCSPIDVLQINGPRSINLNEEGKFTSTLNTTSSLPAEYYWDFGDGTVVQGMNATHKFAKPGTYTITFSATNCGGTDVESFPVTVTGPTTQPSLSIVSLTPSMTSAKVGEVIRFNSEVRGTAPISYRWNFGDGSTSNTTTPTHAYSAAGTYTVILEAQNAAGIDRRMQTIEITKSAVDACDAITELNSVYFAFGSSQLDANAQSRLMENVDVLKGCSNLNIRINGYADHLEPNEMTITQRRAQAVSDFYQSKGIPASRLGVSGKGRDAVSCDKEDPGKGCRRNRRVESIPVKR